MKIFISGYPQHYDEMALAQLISPYGQVRTIKLVRDRQSGKAKGYAFIEMADRHAAEEVAIALDGLEMKEKMLTVNLVEENEPRPVRTYRKVERRSSAFKPKRPRLG